MCEEGAVKKNASAYKLGSANAGSIPAPPPADHGSQSFFITLKKSLKEISLFVEAAEGGTEHWAHDAPLLSLCVCPAQSLLFHMPLGLTAPE